MEGAAITATVGERRELLSGELALTLREIRPDRQAEQAAVPPSPFTVTGTVNNQPQATHGQRKLLWVPPGSYRIGEAEYHRHPYSGDYTEIPNASFTLSRGFWIDADLWTEGQIDYQDWQAVMGKRPYAPLIHGSRSAVKVYRTFTAEQAADFHATATTWRLPTAAQIRAALHVHGPTLRSRLSVSFWLADGWLPTGVDTAAINPQGSLDACVWQINDTSVEFLTGRGDGFDGLHLFNAVGMRRSEAGRTFQISGIQLPLHRAVSSTKHRYLSLVMRQFEHQAALLLVHP